MVKTHIKVKYGKLAMILTIPTTKTSITIDRKDFYGARKQNYGTWPFSNNHAADTNLIELVMLRLILSTWFNQIKIRDRKDEKQCVLLFDYSNFLATEYMPHTKYFLLQGDDRRKIADYWKMYLLCNYRNLNWVSMWLKCEKQNF